MAFTLNLNSVYPRGYCKDLLCHSSNQICKFPLCITSFWSWLMLFLGHLNLLNQMSFPHPCQDWKSILWSMVKIGLPIKAWLILRWKSIHLSTEAILHALFRLWSLYNLLVLCLFLFCLMLFYFFLFLKLKIESSLKQYIPTSVSSPSTSTSSPQLPSHPDPLPLCFLFWKGKISKREIRQTEQNKMQQDKAKALIWRLYKGTQRREE